MAFKVFISYSHKDRDIVNSLYSVLKQSGINVYAAIFYPEPGKQISQKILEEMKSSDCVLLLLTHDSVMSQWVLNEIGMAKALDRLIIPVVEKNVEIPNILAGLEYIKFDKNNPLITIDYIREYFHYLTSWKEHEDRTRLGFGLAALLFGLILVSSSSKDKNQD